jgi:hypothetical protein
MNMPGFTATQSIYPAHESRMSGTVERISTAPRMNTLVPQGGLPRNPYDNCHMVCVPTQYGWFCYTGGCAGSRYIHLWLG